MGTTNPIRIDDDVIYGQIDNLIYPAYDQTVGGSYHTVVFIRDRYINNIIFDVSAGLYDADGVPLGSIKVDVVLPHDVNIQEHYYVHFLSLNTSQPAPIDVTFMIEDPQSKSFNAKHIWQKRKYCRLNGLPAAKLNDLYFFCKERAPGTASRDDIELRDYRQSISHKIIDAMRDDQG